MAKKSVHVKGFIKKDGTKVEPYNRKKPRKEKIKPKFKRVDLRKIESFWNNLSLEEQDELFQYTPYDELDYDNSLYSTWDQLDEYEQEEIKNALKRLKKKK